MSDRTLVRPLSEESYIADKEDMFEVCIDDMKGCGHSHSHNNYGHEFPMTRDELVALRDQIDNALDITKGECF